MPTKPSIIPVDPAASVKGPLSKGTSAPDGEPTQEAGGTSDQQGRRQASKASITPTRIPYQLPEPTTDLIPQSAASRAHGQVKSVADGKLGSPQLLPGSDDESRKSKHMSNDLSSNKGILSPVQSAASAAEHEKRQDDALIDEPIFNPAAAQFLVDPGSTLAASPTSVTLEVDLDGKVCLEAAGSCNKACIKATPRTPSTKTPVSKGPQPSPTTSKVVTTSSPKPASQWSGSVYWLLVINPLTSLHALLLSLGQGLLRGIILSAHLFPRSLKWVPALVSGFIVTAFVWLLLVAFSMLTWPIFWAWRAFTSAIDHSISNLCYWPWLKPFCSYTCDTSPWFVLYLLSSTCSHHMSRSKLGVKSHWETEVDFGNMGNIPRILSAHETRCSFYSAKLPLILNGLAIPENNKNNLLSTQDEICTYLGNFSSLLPSYYRHANIFSESLLYHVNVTRTHIQSALANGSSHNMLVEQKWVSNELSNFMTTWQERIDYLLDPGEFLVQEVRKWRGQQASFLNQLQQARDMTLRARDEVVKSWNLFRRTGRSIGVLQVEPPELYEYNDAIKALDGWILWTLSLESLSTLTYSNVTEVGGHLKDLAAFQLSADIHVQLGPQGLLKLDSHMKAVGRKARGIRKNDNGAMIIERGEMPDLFA